MAKENTQPKAVNIIRPSQTLSVKRPPSTLSRSSRSSAASASSGPPASARYHMTSSASTQAIPANEPRKPRVASSAKIAFDQPTTHHKLNIYHPPQHRSSLPPHRALDAHDPYRQPQQTQSPPSYELYKPGAPPSRPKLPQSSASTTSLSRSMTTPGAISSRASSTTSTNVSSSSAASYARHPPPSVLSQGPTPPTSHSATAKPLAPRSSPRKFYTASHIDRPEPELLESGQKLAEASIAGLAEFGHANRFDDDYDANDSDNDHDHRGDQDFEDDPRFSADDSYDEADRDLDGSEEEEEEEEDEEDDMVSEARVNRKIADLEISNRSLLAVNEMLEITVRKQASQVAQLKKQITQNGDTPILALPTPNQEATESSTEEDWEQDELFSRIRKLTETMIAQGEASLKFEFKNLGRVISNYHSDDDDEEAIENEGDSGEEPKDKEQPEAAGLASHQDDTPRHRSLVQEDISGSRSSSPRRRAPHAGSTTRQPRGSRS